MTGRNRNQPQKGKRKVAAQQVDQRQQSRQQHRQPDQQTLISTSSTQSNQSQSAQSQAPTPAQADDSVASNASNVTATPQRAGKDPPVARKIIKAEIDESRTLKHVFKSNPDSQMKDFIKKAAKPSQTAAAKVLPKTPADAHPPAVAQELLETDDDVADNLGKLFKASKSYKNI